MIPLTHASFFSGVGGLDLGLEQAGWITLALSEIDPYASAVLAERWPGVPNLGDITRVNAGAIPPATLWTGGFPCQDLSVAGKRRGFEGDRSSLAFVFLDLIERHRPAAFLLENVPGLLSSHEGRDMGRLFREVAELGYGVAWRILDARHFGVPQRRRRVFLLALRCDPDDVEGRVAAERAAAVLAVGASCPRHPATGRAPGEEPADRFADGVGGAGALPQAVTSKWYRGTSGPAGDEHHNLVCTSPDARGDGAADGLAGRAHHRGELAHALILAPTLTAPDTRHRTVDGRRQDGSRLDRIDPLLPAGLDSHRYRCCGNGVVAPVAEWIGRRLADYFLEASA